jgi:hypothetical protein
MRQPYVTFKTDPRHPEGREKMAKYDTLKVDPGLAARVAKVMEANPGLWPSRRALYSDLIRRGLLSLERAIGPVSSPPTRPSPASPALPRGEEPSRETGCATESRQDPDRSAGVEDGGRLGPPSDISLPSPWGRADSSDAPDAGMRFSTVGRAASPSPGPERERHREAHVPHGRASPVFSEDAPDSERARPGGGTDERSRDRRDDLSAFGDTLVRCGGCGGRFPRRDLWYHRANSPDCR